MNRAIAKTKTNRTVLICPKIIIINKEVDSIQFHLFFNTAGVTKCLKINCYTYFEKKVNILTLKNGSYHPKEVELII